MKFNETERRYIVLLVDGDQALAEVARKCLEAQGGLDVETAFSSREAFKMMEKIKPDVIVCSFQLQGENPCDFLKELRDKGIAIPFIGLTDDENHLGLKAYHLGASGLVNKFVDPSILYPQLKKLVLSLVEPFDGEES